MEMARPRRDQLGLQDVVVILRLAVHGPGQAVLAMFLAEVELPGAVQDDQEVAEQRPSSSAFMRISRWTI